MFNSVSALVKPESVLVPTVQRFWGLPASPPPDDFPGLINERRLDYDMPRARSDARSEAFCCLIMSTEITTRIFSISFHF